MRISQIPAERWLSSILKVILAACALTGAAYAQDAVDFNFDIRPLLSDRCYVCHGPDEENREADLRLDTVDGLQADAQSGDAAKVVKPDDLQQSELWQRINSDDPDVMMPPPDSNLSLTDDEKTRIRLWIEQGAQHKEHWSFLPFKKTGEFASATEAIDALIAKRQESAGFSFRDEAGKRQLIRRVRFDITGLPPTADELEAFESDDAPDAYERLIDRLLAAEQYGERMAADWLDVARYSDTYGYQVDRDRFVWPYRDWVIGAFNQNMPYNEFVTQQLAGDLLQNPTEDQILATTFNRLHPQKVEGGSVPEEFRIEYVADRTQTFATSMLGLTFECARCHDHKYDPLSQKEYYQLTAFFDKIDEAGLYSYFTQSIPTPTLMLDRAEEASTIEELKRAVSEAASELAKVELKEATEEIGPPAPIEHMDFEAFKPNGTNKSVSGIRGKAVELSGDDGVNLKKGNFHRYEPFSVSLWVNVPDHRERCVVFHRSRAWTDAGSRGYQLLLEDGKLSWSLIHFWPGNAIRVRSEAALPVDGWHHVAVTYDGSSRASGLRIYLDGEPLPVEIVRDNLYRQITGGGNDHITIGQRFRDIGFRQGRVDEFQVFDRELLPAEVSLNFDAKNAERLTDADKQHIALARSESYQKQLAKLKDARKAVCEKVSKYREIMVMQEMAQPRETFVLGRGAYDNRQEKVGAETPAVLPPMDESLPKNRLGLAEWLTDPENPLAARVAVNRIWQMMFGQGLVRTPEDFGSQGQLPTHPVLLDWLSRDFVDSGWDIKRLIKQIAMSKAYRQSSVASSDLLEQDPENVLYARAPSYRWPAEMLRDQALSVSGLLVSKIGGPPAKPYELEVSFKPIKPDQGEGLYRRSVYTFWKRTGPAPAMMALDAAKRDVCRVKRSRTSSPLQTLVLMNSPQFVEAARSLAESVMDKTTDPDERLDVIFVKLTSRKPSAAELHILKNLYEEQISNFNDEKTRNEYLGIGHAKIDKTGSPELAALTAVANTLFGLDECMMKR